jgi:hypothetical protein
MPQDNSSESVISQDNTTVMPQDNRTVIPQDNNKRKERKIKETQVSDKPTLPAGASLARQFQDLINKLRDAKNKQAILMDVYVLCYGDGDPPTFGYLGKVAREVGGAGYLAKRMFELSAQPPAGDVLAYILGEHRNKQNRANGNGKDSPTAHSSWIDIPTGIPEYMEQ